MFEATRSGEAVATARISEDWLAVAIGLAVLALTLLSLAGWDALSWVATTSVWTDPGSALAPASKSYAGLGGGGALVLTYPVDVDFFSGPKPTGAFHEPSLALRAEKNAFGATRAAHWFGHLTCRRA
jgi:hypothetical protein